MTRITSTVLIVLLLLNGSATAMAASGMNEDLGVELAPGISDAMNQAVDELREGFSPSAGAGETLFSMFSAGLQVLRIMITAVGAAPTLFLNVGFPPWIVLPLFAPIYVISTLELVYVGTGRDLV